MVLLVLSTAHTSMGMMLDPVPGRRPVSPLLTAMYSRWLVSST